MTLSDCVRVATGVFVDPTTLYFRDLIATVTDQARNATHSKIKGGGAGILELQCLSRDDVSRQI